MLPLEATLLTTVDTTNFANACPLVRSVNWAGLSIGLTTMMLLRSLSFNSEPAKCEFVAQPDNVAKERASKMRGNMNSLFLVLLECGILAAEILDTNLFS